MTREGAVVTVHAGLGMLPHGDAKAATVAAFRQLVADLELAERLVDEGYDALVEALPALRKADLDWIAFSRRRRRGARVGPASPASSST